VFDSATNGELFLACVEDALVNIAERAGQPAELAPAYVLLASDEASYMTGALVPVTGGRPML
jgi:NAD(P)-dependent dehydrogenase (short-subunit alcohol dehydrogenase family)